MMTVSDIFDALTASDRPYKAAVPVERALASSTRSARQALDSDVLDLFIELKPWESAPKAYVSSSISSVPHAAIAASTKKAPNQSPSSVPDATC